MTIINMKENDDYHYKVAYLGLPGSNSYMAANKYFKKNKNMKLISCQSIAEVFKKVTDRICLFGVVPVENSITGRISPVFDLFLKNKVSIIGEITIPVHHHLLGNGNVDIGNIRLCYSHPQAIAQCRIFLQKHPLIKSGISSDTASAAKQVAESGKKELAAIAGQNAAHKYGLTVIKKNIEDEEGNSTRFAVISKEDSSKLNNLRKIIDLLDEQLLDVLVKRFQLSHEVKKEKARLNIPIEDKKREKEIMGKLKKRCRQTNLSFDFVRRLLREIIEESKRLQK
ncbi:chorismate mutase [Candidatus Microgenomates bacterium]|nr:chorismate mutase [Candidatus Microgenomates bacterium]